MFSWDPQKAIVNFAKHGISFEESATIFSDPLGLDWEDLSHASQEKRYKRLGTSSEGNILLVVYTVRRSKDEKKRSGSSARDGRAARNAKPILDRQIDFSDIPESTDEELRRARRVGRPKSLRPPRQLIAIRIDPALLKQLRKLAAKQNKPYQTYIHELLESAARKAA